MHQSFGRSFINTLRPRQVGGHFPDDVFKCIFLNENIWISIKISLKFVTKGPINNIPASVQIMAWRRRGDKPLSEPMMVRLPTYLCVTRPQWVKLITFRLFGVTPQHNIAWTHRKLDLNIICWTYIKLHILFFQETPFEMPFYSDHILSRHDSNGISIFIASR